MTLPVLPKKEMLLLEPAPQGMGAPQATGNTQGRRGSSWDLTDPSPDPLHYYLIVTSIPPEFRTQNHIPLHHPLRPRWGSDTRVNASKKCPTVRWHHKNKI